MTVDKMFNLLGAVVTVALVTTLVSHPQTAKVINASGSAFSGILRSAMGR